MTKTTFTFRIEYEQLKALQRMVKTESWKSVGEILRWLITKEMEK